VELGVPEELARHRARTLSELRYDITLRIPEDRSAPVEGHTMVRFVREDADDHPVVLDFKDPEDRVRGVEVNGEPSEWRAEADHIVLPPGAFGPGANEVRVDYLAGDEALNRSDEFLYALFVPDRAHFSLPLFDQPNLKAQVAWDIEVPAGWVAVANGPSIAGDERSAEGTDGDGEGERGRYRFQPSRPIPTYLFAFAAGRFEVEEARRGRFRMRMYHRETDSASVARNSDPIFDLHLTALEWLEEYTGIEYPFQKFDFVLIPPFQYGGMEHPGAVTYRQSSLMLDESATQSQLLGRASLIAHETAHMWFGDLVTMNWFDDVWTKEVFANFMAAKIVHPSFPEVNHDLRFLLAHHPRAYGVDRTPGANAIRQPLDNLREAGTLYGAIIYQKAPVVMAHLERTVGEEAFRDGLRRYLDRFAYGNATWPDLIQILDEQSEEDLAEWSRVWVEEPGRPTIQVDRGVAGPGEGSVTITQEDPWGRGRVWPQTLELVGSWDGELERVEVRLDAEPEVVEAWAGRPPPDWVLPMGGGIEYGLFLLDAVAYEAVSRDAQSLEDPRLRGAAWLVLHDAVLEEQMEPGALLDLAVAALEVETDELILARVLQTAATLYWRLLSREERLSRAERLESVLWTQANGTGEVDRPSTARVAFFSAYVGMASTPEALGRLRGIWAREDSIPGLPLSENQEIELAEALALAGVADAEAILESQAERIENPDRSARFAFVRPSLSADPAVREIFFESLRDPANREREPWVLSGLGNLHHPHRRDHGARLVPAALELVEEIQATGDIFFPTGWLSANLGSHNDPSVAETVRDFLDANPDLPARLRGKVLQAADGVRRAARIVHGPTTAPAWATGS
jgi:aminopeptidase N